MGAKVDRAIEAVMAKGHSKSSAIRILKDAGTIKQSGKHLVAGRKKARKKKSTKKKKKKNA